MSVPLNAPWVAFAYMEAHHNAALLFVASELKPSSPATIDEYHQFYNDEFIPAILKLPLHNGPRTVIRYENVSASPPGRPFAAVYPLRDVQMLYGPIRKRAIAMARERPFKSFGGDTAYQHVDFDSYCYRYLHALDSSPEKKAPELAGGGAGSTYPVTMIADSIDAPDDPSSRLREEALFKSRYQLPWRFWVCEHHLRSISYKLLTGKAPKYLVLHFFILAPENMGADVLTAGAKECADRQVYRLLCSQGEMTYPPPPHTATTPTTPASLTPDRTEPNSRRCSEELSSSKKSPSLKSTTSWGSI